MYDADEADLYPPVYDFEAWKNHRSRGRFVEHMLTLGRSFLVRSLFNGPLVDVTIICLLVGTYETLLEGGHLSMLPWLPDLAISAPEPFHQTSFALSLMLVFRTNSSYARWAEARQCWGVIVNTCRDICRQVCCEEQSSPLPARFPTPSSRCPALRGWLLSPRATATSETPYAAGLWPLPVPASCTSAKRAPCRLQCKGFSIRLNLKLSRRPNTAQSRPCR